MSGSEWVTVMAFVGVVYGLSLWNPTVAAMLAGTVLLVSFVNSGIANRFINGGTP